MPSKLPNLVSVTTIAEDGSHVALHPSDVRGRFTMLRRIFSLLLILLYVGLPWIPIAGKPALFFDLANGRFHIFGLTFLTQDFWLAFFLISGAGFALFYITALFGRLWCGWACPYTVFLEHVFRRIERWIDGDSAARHKLDRAPLSVGKVTKRITKHLLYIICAAAIAHVFLSYFISIGGLYRYMGESPLAHFKSFAIVVALTAVLYFCFAWFREQFCIILCPYGRIQSALTDDDTLIIGYDSTRGEPRGKATDPDAGSCIDCRRCVTVCPTGIDIRNGLQLECIGCAACIDACDEIMDKIDRPRGLVRYDSFNGLAGVAKRIIRPRILLYTALMMVGASVLTFALTRVHDVEVLTTRMAGMPYYVTDDAVRNQFKIRLFTKRAEPTTFTLSLEGAPEGTIAGGLDQPIILEPLGSAEQPLTVIIPRELYTGPGKFQLTSRSEPGGTTITHSLDFVGPDARLLAEDAEKSEPEK